LDDPTLTAWAERPVNARIQVAGVKVVAFRTASAPVPLPVSLADQHLSVPSDEASLSRRRALPATVVLDARAMPSQTGQSSPLGATVLSGGVNFSVFSRQATRVDLLLFDSAEAAQPARVIELDPRTHRTYHYWHVFVPGIGTGQLYAYRAFGPFDPAQGLRFDPSKVLLDPYGRAVVLP
jgi:hypothetical protein